MARGHRRPPTRLRSPTSSSPKMFPAPTGRLVGGPAMVTGELTGRVLALDVAVPCP